MGLEKEFEGLDKQWYYGLALVSQFYVKMKKAKSICVRLMPLPRQWSRIIEKQLSNNPWNWDFNTLKSNTVKGGTKKDLFLHLNCKKKKKAIFQKVSNAQSFLSMYNNVLD